MHRLHKNFWPAASTTSGEAAKTLMSVRSSVVSVSVSATVRPSDAKTVTLTVMFAGLPLV